MNMNVYLAPDLMDSRETFSGELTRFIEAHTLRDATSPARDMHIDVSNVVIFIAQNAIEAAGFKLHNNSYAELHGHCQVTLAIADVLASAVNQPMAEIGGPALDAMFSKVLGFETLDSILGSVAEDWNALTKQPMWRDRFLDIMTSTLTIIRNDDLQPLVQISDRLIELQQWYAQALPSQGLAA